MYATDGWAYTLHWARIFNFVHVYFLCTQRSFIIKSSQRSRTKYLILSGKLLVATAQVSHMRGAPTARNPEITCSKVKRIIFVRKRY